MANQVPPGTKLFVADDPSSIDWKELGKDCLRVYEPSPILKMINEDVERTKEQIRDMSLIPLSHQQGKPDCQHEFVLGETCCIFCGRSIRLEESHGR